MKAAITLLILIFALGTESAKAGGLPSEAGAPDAAPPAADPAAVAKKNAEELVAGLAKLDPKLDKGAQEKLTTALTAAAQITDPTQRSQAVIAALKNSGVVIDGDKGLTSLVTGLKNAGVELSSNDVNEIGRNSGESSRNRGEADRVAADKDRGTRQNNNDAQQRANNAQQAQNNQQQRNNNQQQNQNQQQQAAQNQAKNNAATGASGMQGQQQESETAASTSGGAEQPAPGGTAPLKVEAKEEKEENSVTTYVAPQTKGLVFEGVGDNRGTLDETRRRILNLPEGGGRTALGPTVAAATMPRNSDPRTPAASSESRTGFMAAAGSSRNSRYILDATVNGIVGSSGGGGRSYSEVYGSDVREEAVGKSAVNRGTASTTVLEQTSTPAGGHKPR